MNPQGQKSTNDAGSADPEVQKLIAETQGGDQPDIFEYWIVGTIVVMPERVLSAIAGPDGKPAHPPQQMILREAMTLAEPMRAEILLARQQQIKESLVQGGVAKSTEQVQIIIDKIEPLSTDALLSDLCAHAAETNERLSKLIDVLSSLIPKTP